MFGYVLLRQERVWLLSNALLQMDVWSKLALLELQPFAVITSRERLFAVAY